MRKSSRMPRSRVNWLLALGLGATNLLAAGQAYAGCGAYDDLLAPPMNWDAPAPLMRGLVPTVYRFGAAGAVRTDFNPGVENAGIVGLWKVTFVSDGTAYPAAIPEGVVVDFATVQWHSDGTEFMVSGARPPSTGDVCMGVWQKIGPATYKLKHVALAWASSDTPPSMGGAVSPAVFVGPAIIRQVVTLSHSANSYSGTFTIDQYAQDEVTLLQHVGGRISATRITVD